MASSPIIRRIGTYPDQSVKPFPSFSFLLLLLLVPLPLFFLYTHEIPGGCPSGGNIEDARRPVADYTRHMNPHMLIYLHAHTHEGHTRGTARVELTARSMRRSCRHLRNC